MLYIIVFLMGVLAYSLVIILLGKKSYRTQMLKDRIDKYRKVSVDRKDDFDEDLPFSERIIKPIAEEIIKAISNIFPKGENEQNQLQETLFQAGIKMPAREYNIMKILVSLLFGVFGAVFFSFNGGVNIFKNILGFIGGTLFGYIIMVYLLQRRLRIRQENMEKQFPEFLDLLCVCIESGLGFDQAVQYVVKEYKSELSDEFKTVVRDISLGSTRKNALLELQKRATFEQLKTFNSAVIQADEMGISLKKILNAQSYNARETRKQKIEEEVQKLPVKILFPMLFFIFPIIFVVLLYPAITSVLGTLSGTSI